VKLSEGTKQRDLVITPLGEPEVTVDSIEFAQFVYLLLHNEKIRDVIDTVGKKGVLLLGRFTEGRIAVLERLRGELRKRGFLPIVFNFDKPETKDFTETIRLLARVSKFVIADITNPKSAPLELQATVPEIMVPFWPIIQEGETPFAMLQDLWIKHRDWVFEPIYYSSLDALIGVLDEKIIRPAEVRFAELLARKAEKMRGEHVYCPLPAGELRNRGACRRGTEGGSPWVPGSTLSTRSEMSRRDFGISWTTLLPKGDESLASFGNRPGR